MKVSNTSLLALLLPTVSARFVELGEPDRTVLYPDGISQPSKESQKYHIELSPGVTRWVTEEEKWALRRVSMLKNRAFARRWPRY
jgi:leucyl aminopeptidase